MNANVDNESNRYNSNNPMDNLESELKMMKNLNNFPMQMPSLPMFPNTDENNLASCNISPNASTPTNPRSNQNVNDVDVDAGSTPRSQHLGATGGLGTGPGNVSAGAAGGGSVPPGAGTDCSVGSVAGVRVGSTANETGSYTPLQHHTPPSPQAISPGRDYGMFATVSRTNTTPNLGATTANRNGSGNGSGSNGNGNGTANSASSNNISASSPLPGALAQTHRGTASSVGSSYPEHELISPASSPSIPRYNFNNGDVMRHKHRVEQEVAERRQHVLANHSGHNQISSDEENSMMPHNRYERGIAIIISILLIICLIV